LASFKRNSPLPPTLPIPLKNIPVLYLLLLPLAAPQRLDEGCSSHSIKIIKKKELKKQTKKKMKF
jgi:hypothetical protein